MPVIFKVEKYVYFLVEEQIEYIQFEPPPTGQKTDQVKILNLRPETNQNHNRLVITHQETRSPLNQCHYHLSVSHLSC